VSPAVTGERPGGDPSEQQLSQEEIFTLSDMAGDETHKARKEVDKWWDTFMARTA
jgi:hypothetical protein